MECWDWSRVRGFVWGSAGVWQVLGMVNKVCRLGFEYLNFEGKGIFWDSVRLEIGFGWNYEWFWID